MTGSRGFLGLALVATAIAFGLHAVAGGIRDRGANDTVSVVGSAKQRIESDVVIWEAFITAQAATTQEAAKQLDGWTASMTAFIDNQGITEDELTVTPISTEPIYSGPQNKLTGYRLSRSFRVRSTRVDEVVASIEASAELVRTGIPVTTAPPQFIYTKLAELRPALSAEATKNALSRARTVVETAGQKLGKLRDISVGPLDVTPPDSADAGGFGSYDTSTRTKDVTSIVNVTFSVE
ncbi:MAG: SIMPL domain-containing protein [Gaiella sp.]